MTIPESFIPKEMGVLPRILLLDFSENDASHLRSLGYEVIEAHTGFSNIPHALPRHESEIEIIFWDMSNICRKNSITTTNNQNYGHNTFQGEELIKKYTEVLERYFERIANKKGFVGIFLDETINVPMVNLSDLLNSDFTFNSRKTSTLYLKPHKENDIWFDFYKRFIKNENIHFAINWNDNLVDFINYFEDEDTNIHAVTYRHFAIIPKIENKKIALTYLMQDVLPYHCKGKNIFPDKYYYRWTNNDQYLPSKVPELRSQINKIIADSNEQTEKRMQQIKSELDKSEYLTNMLIADDSDLFTEDKKLSTSIHKVLEDDLGFKVTDVDEMRLQIGESLKEDKWIEDDDFFALVEIKGTEKGAKANWIRQDLTAHIREFEIVKDVTNINSLLIFNHERREAPEERSVPFSGDGDLITFSQKSNICLLPVYELFKIVRDVKKGIITQEDARKKIKTCKGMFIYNSSN